MIEDGLLKDNDQLPKFGPLMEARVKEEAKAKAKKAKMSKDKRTTYAIQAYTENWRYESTHRMLGRLAKKHNIRWLRIRMAYTRLRNLQEMLLADLAGKLMENVTYLDKGQTRPYKKVCGCQKNTLVNSECIFKDFPQNCRTRDCVYSVTWIPTGKIYDGKTSVPIKERVLTQHLGDTQKAFSRREQFQKKLKESKKKSQMPKKRGRKPLKEITNDTDLQKRPDDKEGKKNKDTRDRTRTSGRNKRIKLVGDNPLPLGKSTRAREETKEPIQNNSENERMAQTKY